MKGSNNNNKYYIQTKVNFRGRYKLSSKIYTWCSDYYLYNSSFSNTSHDLPYNRLHEDLLLWICCCGVLSNCCVQVLILVGKSGLVWSVNLPDLTQEHSWKPRQSSIVWFQLPALVASTGDTTRGMDLEKHEVMDYGDVEEDFLTSAWNLRSEEEN